MVGRLVEQQQVGLGEQQRGKRHAHAPTAGERVERAVLRLFVEAEAGENARGPRRRAMGVDGVEPLVDLGDAMGVARVLRFLEQGRSLGRRREHGLERRCLPSRRFLRDIADAHA